MKCEHNVFGYCYAGVGCYKCPYEKNLRKCDKFEMRFEKGDMLDIELVVEYCTKLSKRYKFQASKHLTRDNAISFCKNIAQAQKLGLELNTADATFVENAIAQYSQEDKVNG